MTRIALAAVIAASAAPAFAGGPVIVPAEPFIAAPVVATRADGDWTGPYVGLQLGYGDIGSSGDVLNGDGVIGGVHGGYRYDFGQAVVGAEIDYDVANIDLGNEAGELDSVARFKLQAGYDAGRALIYGTAGYAGAEASVGDSDLSGDGYFYGIGADYALTDRITLGGEILKHEFDDFDNTGIDLDATTVKAKMSLRF